MLAQVQASLRRLERNQPACLLIISSSGRRASTPGKIRHTELPCPAHHIIAPCPPSTPNLPCLNIRGGSKATPSAYYIVDPFDTLPIMRQYALGEVTLQMCPVRKLVHYCAPRYKAPLRDAGAEPTGTRTHHELPTSGRQVAQKCRGRQKC